MFFISIHKSHSIIVLTVMQTRSVHYTLHLLISRFLYCCRRIYVRLVLGKKAKQFPSIILTAFPFNRPCGYWILPELSLGGRWGKSRTRLGSVTGLTHRHTGTDMHSNSPNNPNQTNESKLHTERHPADESKSGSF